MKRLWIWFQSLSRFKQIGISVLSIHAVLVLMLSINHVTARRLKPQKPIAIRMALVPTSATETRAPKPASKNPTQKAPLTKDMKKTVSPKKVTTASESKKKSAPAKKATEIDNALLQQIATSLEAVSSPIKVLKQPHTRVALPSSIEIQNSVRTSFSGPGYGETISAILQKNLDLPEFGEVVAKIEIDASGKVMQCEILETKSQKNADFLKKRLQELAFPCFNEFRLSETRLKFTITFRNVENR